MGIFPVGEAPVPGDFAVIPIAFWGAQTQRSVENAPIGRQRMPIEIVHALARGAAASTSRKA